MLDKFVGHLRDMYKSVLMHSDIHKCAEINNVSDGSLEDHSLSEIFHLQHIAPQDRFRHLITWIPGGFLKLLDNVCESYDSCSQFFGKFLDIACGFGKLLKVALRDII